MMKHAGSEALLVMVVLAAVIAVAGTAAADRRAKPSTRYVCAQGRNGLELPATRANILLGVCVPR